MQLKTRTLAAAVAAALTFGLMAAPGASAAPVVREATVAPIASPVRAQLAGLIEAASKKATPKITLKRSALGFHRGKTGVKVSATIKVRSAVAKGKARFYDGKKVLRTVTLKRGKAAVRLSANSTWGVHKITVRFFPSAATKRKVASAKKSTTVKVWNSSLRLAQSVFTISKATDSYDLSAVAGSVIYKGVKPAGGYVDIYRDGKYEGGYGSAPYVGMASVKNGAFSFGAYSFLAKVQEMPVGTYRFKAFYTAGSGFDDYIYSSWITVTVTA